MSMRDKLIEAAKIAALEATTNERARCLWCADEVVRELEAKLAKKILRSATEEQVAHVKVQIARGVVSELRRAIISGVRPVTNRSETGAAGLSVVPDASVPPGTIIAKNANGEEVGRIEGIGPCP